MNRDLARQLRDNPDIAALALLITLLVPQLGGTPRSIRLTLASRSTAPTAERIWQRLENKMRMFEQRFDKVAPPRARCVNTPDVEAE
ncbi:MAG TPA: hypothetical protein VGK29_11080 [Paludibaculum sp.]|jgi:hypothetical protein